MNHFSRLIFCVILLAISAACSAKTSPPPMQAIDYFREGEQFFEDKNYREAINSWEKVRDSYYSPELNALAEMKIADSHFLAEQYLEAAAACEAFLKKNPDHPRTPEVLYRLGLSYFRQINDPDQDQTATRQALAAFQTLNRRFPDSPHRNEADGCISACLNQLAANELAVGRYYLKAGKTSAAINRLTGVFKQYGDFPGRAEALYLLGQAYLKSGERMRADEAFSALSSQYPGSEYVAASQKLIERPL